MPTKKATKKGKKKPYNPLQSPYPNQGAFNKAVKTTAMSGIKPQLGELNTQGRYEAGAHKTRSQQIGGWYGGQTDAARASANNLQQASQSLLGSTQAGNQGAYDAMSAAVNKINADATKSANELGVGAKPVDPNTLLATQAYGQGGNLSLIGDIAAAQAHANALAPQAQMAGTEAGLQENAKFNATKRDIEAQRRQLKAQIPGLMETARSNLSQTELARSGQRFQQGLARDQFGLQQKQFGEDVKNSRAQRTATRAQTRLATRQFGETQRAQKVSERQRDNELGISQQNADTQRAQVIADAQTVAGKGNDEVVKARAKQFDKGITILQNAWKMTDADKVYKEDKDHFQTKDLDPGKVNQRMQHRMHGQFNPMVNQIMANTGLTKMEALRVMMAAPNNGWRREAQRQIKVLKEYKKINKQYGPGHYPAIG
jgi:hypothetical protein